MLDFIRMACAVPAVQVGNIEKNAQEICRFMAQADGQQVDVLTFPELSITGYSCADLFFQSSMLRAEKQGLTKIVACSAEYPRLTAVVGLTVTVRGQLYNCAAVISNGTVQGIVPKTFVTEDECRYFASAAELPVNEITGRMVGLEEDYAIPMGRSRLLGDRSILYLR